MADVSEVSIISSFVDTIIKAGPTTIIFAGLWWMEKKNSNRLLDRLLEMAESVKAMNDTWLKILPKQSRRRGDGE